MLLFRHIENHHKPKHRTFSFFCQRTSNINHFLLFRSTILSSYSYTEDRFDMQENRNDWSKAKLSLDLYHWNRWAWWMRTVNCNYSVDDGSIFLWTIDLIIFRMKKKEYWLRTSSILLRDDVRRCSTGKVTRKTIFVFWIIHRIIRQWRSLTVSST